MADRTVLTVQDYLFAAWAAHICGDIAERDGLSAMVERTFYYGGVIFDFDAPVKFRPRTDH